MRTYSPFPLVVVFMTTVLLAFTLACSDDGSITPTEPDADATADPQIDPLPDADPDVVSDLQPDTPEDCTSDDDCSAEAYCDQVCLSGCRIEPDNCQIGTCDELTRECTYDLRFQPVVEAAEAEFAAMGATGAAVALVQDGEVIFSFGWGRKHRNEPDPVMPTTLFRIASVSKPLTAIGLLRLVDSGEVSLDSPIGDLLPDLSFVQDPTLTERILVRHLLTHSSGLPNSLTNWPSECATTDCLADYCYGTFAEVGYAAAPPGRLYSYSNESMILLGLINQAVSGLPYEQYMRERVFEPLGMQRTVISPVDVLDDGDFAYGGGLRAPDQHHNTWEAPAAGAFSSVLDLAELMTFFMNGDPDVLSDELWSAMQQPQLSTERYVTESVGYGIHVYEGFLDGPVSAGLQSDYYDVGLVEHAGHLQDFETVFSYVRDLDCGFVAVANTGRTYTWGTWQAFLRNLCGMPGPTSPPAELAFDPTDFDVFVGTYDDPHFLGQIDVFLEGDQLRAEAHEPGFAGTYDLTPIWRNNFTLPFTGGTQWVTFILDEDGQAEYLRINDGAIAARVE